MPSNIQWDIEKPQLLDIRSLSIRDGRFQDHVRTRVIIFKGATTRTESSTAVPFVGRCANQPDVIWSGINMTRKNCVTLSSASLLAGGLSGCHFVDGLRSDTGDAQGGYSQEI
ncbi:MAG: hypothetical protein M1339_02360 [Bacteroidetes bacterium]|nr:hypothetical protein [Bacteroidota bacterium]